MQTGRTKLKAVSGANYPSGQQTLGNIALVIDPSIDTDTLRNIKSHFYRGKYDVSRVFRTEKCKNGQLVEMEDGSGISVLNPEEAKGFAYVDFYTIVGEEIFWATFFGEKVQQDLETARQKRQRIKAQTATAED
jgi:hypothetical protein